MRKTKITLLFLLLASISSYSQISKGKIYIGASSGFGASFVTNTFENDNFSEETATLNSFSIKPHVGYVVSDNFVAGLEFTFSYSNVALKDSQSDSTNSSYIVGPFLKYYFTEKEFKPFLLAQYGFGNQYSKYESLNNKSETEEKATVLILGGGASYFITDNIGLEFGVHYSRSTFQSKINNPINNKSINSGIVTSIGFVLIF